MFTSQIEWRKTQLVVEQEEWWFESFDEISLDLEEISLDLVDIRQIW